MLDRVEHPLQQAIMLNRSALPSLEFLGQTHFEVRDLEFTAFQGMKWVEPNLRSHLGAQPIGENSLKGR
jgi:hypothetical protein